MNSKNLQRAIETFNLAIEAARKRGMSRDAVAEYAIGRTFEDGMVYAWEVAINSDPNDTAFAIADSIKKAQGDSK